MESQIQPFTVIEPWRFEAITPSQFITFTMQNPLNHRQLLDALVLRFAVLDSPTAKADDESPVIAAMIVPNGRELDWNFCSKSGVLQLLFKFHNVSRLILISNNPPTKPRIAVYKRPPPPDTIEQEMLEKELKPLLMSMHPQVNFNRGLPESLFLTYEDEDIDVAYRVTVAELTGPVVGDFLVEDIELVGNTDRNKQLRRRLRFKRTPNFVQSLALLIPVIPYDEGTTQTDLESLRKIENAKFEGDTTILFHHYLNPMVAGLSLIASHLNERIQLGLTPRALCLGVGGGVLLSFLNTGMAFEVTGVEADQMVLTAATKYFGLDNSGVIRFIVGDAMESIQNFPRRKTGGDTDESQVDEAVPDARFDVVFVDLDSSDSNKKFSAPPPEFVKKPVFECLRSILDDHGVLIMNVVPLNEVFYTTLVNELKEIFQKVYGIDVVNQENFVVMATTGSKASNISDDDNEFLQYLRSVIPGCYVDSIVEL